MKAFKSFTISKKSNNQKAPASDAATASDAEGKSAGIWTLLRRKKEISDSDGSVSKEAPDMRRRLSSASSLGITLTKPEADSTGDEEENLTFAPISPLELDDMTLNQDYPSPFPNSASVYSASTSPGVIEVVLELYSPRFWSHDVAAPLEDMGNLTFEELEGFVVETTLSTLEKDVQYQNLISHQAWNLLSSCITRALYKSIEETLPREIDLSVRLFGKQSMEKLVLSRIPATVQYILRRKRKILPNSKCIAGTVGMQSETGLRDNNEDRCASFPYLAEVAGIEMDKPLSFFAVYDGHGGIECSNFVASRLHLNLARHPEIFSDPRRVVTETFLNTNNEWAYAASRHNYADTTGTTAVTALLHDRNLLIAWAGDSSAVLFLHNGVYLDFVFPHKPTFEAEKRRIEELGGYIQNERVNGCLAVSRSFGDTRYGVVIPEPDIMEYTLTGNEAFLLLACDGLTDVMEAADTFEFVMELRGRGLPSQSIAQALTTEALHRGSTDNVSVVYVPLDAPIEYTSEAISEPITLETPQPAIVSRSNSVRSQQSVASNTPEYSQNRHRPESRQLNTFSNSIVEVSEPPSSESTVSSQVESNVYGKKDFALTLEDIEDRGSSMENTDHSLMNVSRAVNAAQQELNPSGSLEDAPTSRSLSPALRKRDLTPANRPNSMPLEDYRFSGSGSSPLSTVRRASRRPSVQNDNSLLASIMPKDAAPMDITELQALAELSRQLFFEPVESVTPTTVSQLEPEVVAIDTGVSAGTVEHAEQSPVGFEDDFVDSYM